MSIILVGLNHRTAPVELRERLSLAGCGLNMALEDLYVKTQQGTPDRLSESVILSTCNRLEIYAVVGEAQKGWHTIETFLSHLQGVPLQELRPHLYYKDGNDVVDHLMRVSAGLDSMILGEPQILGQVSDAYTKAHKQGVTGPILSHLFTQAIHAGKRARTETDISRHTTSVSHAAALLAQDTIGNLVDKNILLIGAGEMAEQAADALKVHGAQTLMCINRTYSRAETLARQIGGETYNWYHLPQALTEADVVISATGAPHTILYTDDVQKVLPDRNGRPLLLVDIAVPRDIEEAIGDLPGVILHDIDDLQHTLDENMAQRKAAIPHVEAILTEESTVFANWLSGREVVPVIKDLRRWAVELARSEVELACHKLDDPAAQDIVNKLAHRIVNKILHEPTCVLKSQAAEGNGYGYAHTVRELFALDNGFHNELDFMDTL